MAIENASTTIFITWTKNLDFSNSLHGKDLINMLDHFAKQVNPFLARFEEIFNWGYFLCLAQCGYATDVIFKSRNGLEAIYKDYLERAIIYFKSDDIMTFMGRKMHPAFSGEVVSDIKKRPQGFRLKHRMKKNSIKMYDKYSVLRVETTINDHREFKVYKETSKDSLKKWVPMGKSISNLYCYSQVSESANRRYFDAGNHINGFTNASLRKALFSDAAFDDIKNRNKVTRLLPSTYCYNLFAAENFAKKQTFEGE
jgi:hypothetical protein